MTVSAGALVQDGAQPDLRGLVAYRMDIQKARIAAEQRGMPGEMTKPLDLLEDRLDAQIKRELKAHPIWPWLSRYKGLGGFQVARIIAIIGDPRRFPGQRCTAGHHIPTAEELGASDETAGVGNPCPVETVDGPCTGTMLPPRPGSGVRSLWHYCGLHAVDGRSPRKRKGQRHDWNDEARTAVLMPGGIADSIVKSRTPKYRDVYDDTKLRLIATRADGLAEADKSHGAEEGTEVGFARGSENTVGLRPFQINAIAKKVAAKAFLGDLLIEWKRLLRADHLGEIAGPDGLEQTADLVA